MHQVNENDSVAAESTPAPRVALGIVTRDRAEVLGKAIDSALAQSYPGLQVWVLNDHSSDNTSQIAGEYPNIGFVDNPRTLGCIASRALLMKIVDADYFVSLDDDAWFLTGDEVALAVQYLQEHRGAGAVAFDILSPDKPDPQPRGAARQVSMFIGCGHVVRMKAFQEVGGYAASPGTYGSEEKDLALRLLDVGHQVVTLPGVHVWHDKTEVARVQPDQHCSGVCNDLALALRRTPLSGLPFALLTKFLRHLQFSYTHQLEEPFWDGVRLFLEAMPDLWRSRRPVRLSTLRRFVKLTKR